MLKRAGRGQDPAGVEGTSEGEFVVECPACPHPGQNMLDDWKDAPVRATLKSEAKHSVL